MQTTLRIDDQIYRTAKSEAARRGMTLTRFIEEALRAQVSAAASDRAAEVADRNAMMERLLESTAHFRVGTRPTRAEMNER